MNSILDIQKKYFKKIDSLDVELLLSHTIQKPREFVLAHPEFELNGKQNIKFEKLLERRLNHEPIAYILREKEFYGLNFKVTPETLIPRPETEILIEKALDLIRTNKVRTNVNTTVGTKQKNKTTIIDVGTGSGNIIISIAKNLNSFCLSRLNKNDNIFYGIDISKNTLRIARYNAKKNKISKQIKFIKSDLLNYFLQTKNCKLKANKLIIIANLPYISKKIYSTVSLDIKNHEPKSALYSANNGLAHYENLFKQIKKLETRSYLPRQQTCKLGVILEFSPEQKTALQKLIKKHFPKTKPIFSKDLAKKWRVVQFEL